MPLFNFNQEEMLSFFAVLVRYSVLFSVLPFFGDRMVPATVKILLSLAVSFALFPALISTGQVRPGESMVWAATTGGIATTVFGEAMFGLVLGFTAKMAFDAIHFGANLAGNFMGFGMASAYDPHHETQTQVVAEIQMAIAMLIFVAVDWHHAILKASLESYAVVGLGWLGTMGKAALTQGFIQKLIEVSGQTISIGARIAAPVAISLFAVNVAFGVMARAMPQLNVLVLSFAVSALVGLIALLVSVPEFQGVVNLVFGRMNEWMKSMMLVLASGR